VAAAAHGDSDAVIARDLQRELNIARIGAARNCARPPIDRAVPNAPQAIEFMGAGVKNTAPQLRLQVLRKGRDFRHRVASRRFGLPA
jgi:hypothetical protein